MPALLQATRASYLIPPKFNQEVRNTSRSVSSDVESPYFRSVGSFTVDVLLIPFNQSFVKILKKRKNSHSQSLESESVVFWLYLRLETLTFVCPCIVGIIVNDDHKMQLFWLIKS